MSMCDDQRVPKPATGKTPVRNARIPDEVWLPALARAEMEGRSASDAMTEGMRRYATESPAAAYAFTLDNWPDAREWLRSLSAGIGKMYDDLFAAGAVPDFEYLAVATWLAVTHHPGDVAQQKRVITGHILRFAMRFPEGGWRDRYRDSRHLSETIQVILEQHLPHLA